MFLLQVFPTSVRRSRSLPERLSLFTENLCQFR